jgi:hypothetical protein
MFVVVKCFFFCNCTRHDCFYILFFDACINFHCVRPMFFFRSFDFIYLIFYYYYYYNFFFVQVIRYRMDLFVFILILNKYFHIHMRIQQRYENENLKNSSQQKKIHKTKIILKKARMHCIEFV